MAFQTWRDLKSNTKKRALKQQQSLGDNSGGMSSEGSADTSQNLDGENYVPPQKRFGITSFLLELTINYFRIMGQLI